MRESQPPPDLARIQSIIDRTEDIIPVLRLYTLGWEQAGQFITEESKARAETVDRLRNILLPYEAALHGRLTDIFTHPEDILLHKRDTVQFAIPSGENGYLTFISIETQRQQVGGKNFRFCKLVTFCKSQIDAVKKLHQEFLFLKFHKSIPLMTNKLPDVYTYAVSLSFDQRGKVSYIATKDPDSWRRDLNVYFLDRNDFRVKSGFYNTKNRSFLLDDVAYILCTDGKFRRAKQTFGTNMSLEWEIATVLARLPFEDYKLPTTSKQQ